MNCNKFSKILLAAIFINFAFTSCTENKKRQDTSLTKKDGVLTIGTEYGYPPFEYIAEDGKTLIGFDVDLWNELCRRINLTPEYFDTQWAGLFPALESNRYDCIISAVTITPSRKEKFLITKPYVQNSDCFVVRKNSKLKIDSPKKLEGLKVAYQAETVSDVFVTTLKENGLNCKTFEYDKLLDAFDDLRFERVDVVVAESVAANIIAKNNQDIYRVDYVGEPNEFFGILVNKNNHELFDLIQSTLDKMYADGWMKENEKKWLR